jgi:tetratricopeptide (TPR) repeat protein
MNDSFYWTLHERGATALQEARLTDAEEAFEEAHREARELGVSGLADRAFCNLVGVRLERAGHPEDSMARLSEILGSSTDEKARQLSAYYLAISHRMRGNPRAARFYAEMAVRLAEAMGDPSGQASSLDLLGLLTVQEGRLEPAVEIFRRSLESSGRIGASSYVLITASTLGYCLGLLERWAESLYFLEESQQALEEPGARLYAPAARLNLGFAFLEHEDFDQAIEQGEAVLTLMAGQQSFLKYAHYLLGEAHAQQGNPRLATEHFEILQKTWYPQHPDLPEVLLSFRTSRLLNWLSR